MPSLSPTIFTVPQVAARLGITPNRVRVLVRAGRLKSTQFGRQYIINLPDLEAFEAVERKPGKPKK